MIRVKFFGLLQIAAKIKELMAADGSVKDVVEEVLRNCPQINRKELLQSIVVINRERVRKGNAMKRILRDGDELVFLSPSSGG